MSIGAELGEHILQTQKNSEDLVGGFNPLTSSSGYASDCNSMRSIYQISLEDSIGWASRCSSCSSYCGRMLTCEVCWAILSVHCCADLVIVWLMLCEFGWAFCLAVASARNWTSPSQYRMNTENSLVSQSVEVTVTSECMECSSLRVSLVLQHLMSEAPV